ncbi:MAG: hypothetical protein M1818_005226 [Claussenomyces sp. TS43310]|nr:MAG: hypothetical protein M1818_005226 [Claussenomyces sp. TS43310]
MAATRDDGRVDAYLQSRKALFKNLRRNHVDAMSDGRYSSSGSEGRPPSSASDREASVIEDMRREPPAGGRDASRAQGYLSNSRPLFKARRRTFADAQRGPLFGGDDKDEDAHLPGIQRARTESPHDRLSVLSRKGGPSITAAYRQATVEETERLEREWTISSGSDGGTRERLANGDADARQDASPSPAPLGRSWGSRARGQGKWLQRNFATLPDSSIEGGSQKEAEPEVVKAVDDTWADLDFTARSGHISTSPKLEIRDASGLTSEKMHSVLSEEGSEGSARSRSPSLNFIEDFAEIKKPFKAREGFRSRSSIPESAKDSVHENKISEPRRDSSGALRGAGQSDHKENRNPRPVQPDRATRQIVSSESKPTNTVSTKQETRASHKAPTTLPPPDIRPEEEKHYERTVLEEEGEAIPGTPVVVFKGAADRPEFQSRHKREDSHDLLRRLAKALSPDASAASGTRDGIVTDHEAKGTPSRGPAPKTKTEHLEASKPNVKEEEPDPEPTQQSSPRRNEPQSIAEEAPERHGDTPHPHRKRLSAISTPPRSDVDPEERIAAEASLFEPVDTKSECDADEGSAPPPLLNTAKLASVQDDLRDILAEIARDDNDNADPADADAGSVLDRLGKRLRHNLSSIRDAKAGLRRLETQVAVAAPPLSLSPPLRPSPPPSQQQQQQQPVYLQLPLPHLWQRSRVGFFRLTPCGLALLGAALWLLAEDTACASYCRLDALGYWEPVNPHAPAFGWALVYALGQFLQWLSALF